MADRFETETEREYQQARHERQMMLMREMGKINRQETCVYIMWGIAAACAIIALFLSAVS